MRPLKSLLLKYRSNLIVILSLFLIGIALVSIYFSLEVRVTSNDECLWITKKVSKDSTAIFFDVVKVEGVTWNAGIRNGDQLLEINGVLLSDVFQAQGILNKFDSGEYADYKVVKRMEKSSQQKFT